MAAKEDTLGLVEFVPDEILILIFSKLPLQDVLLCVRQVCTRWFRLSKDESLWKDVDFSSLRLGSEYKDKEKNSNGAHKLVLEVEDFVEKITFSNVPFSLCAYNLFSSNKLENKCDLRKLRSLDYSYSSVSIGCLRRALVVPTQLQELILVHTNILYGEIMAEAVHLPFLKKLVFHDLHAWDSMLEHHQDTEYSRMFNKRVTIQLSQNCTQLEWVELCTVWIDLDNDIFLSFNKHCPRLKRLYVTWSSQLTPKAFVNKSACSNISHLGLADRLERDPYLNFVLPHFSNLISLTVNGREVHADDCVAVSQCCPNLQELVFDLKTMREHDCLFDYYLHRHNTLSGESLKQIAEGCRQLRKLHAPCSKVDDYSIQSLSSNCPNLEDVNFMHCSLLSLPSLTALSENSENLRYANFQHTFDPQENLVVFLGKCPLLQEINFDLSMSITDAMSFSCSPLHSPANSSCTCSSLSRLQDGCPHNGFSDDLPFIDMMSSLETFEDHSDAGGDNTFEFPMENSLESFNDASYEPVPQAHCHVKKISVRNIRISNITLQEIFHSCPDLTHIVLDGCFDLNNTAIVTLVKCCRNLKVLMMSANQVNTSEVGDGALKGISKYSQSLEVLSVLYNRNLTRMGVFAIFSSLDTILRKLRSFSFCVGSQYGCKMPLKPPFGADYLTDQARASIGNNLSSEFRILHLEFKERRTLL